MYDDSIHPELPRDRVKALDVEPIELGAGDAVVWHALLWHYSPINASDRNRLGIAQVTLSQADAQVARKANLPALIRRRGQGQAALTRGTERRAPG